MNRKELIAQIHKKKSFLCVGLDVDLEKIPEFILDYEDPVFEFNRRIIDATKDYVVAYKPNIAFYEAMGYRGWISLQKTLDYIPKDIFTIADAKRGDIGNTGKMYAQTYFDTFDFDALTVAPYMGSDSVSPFLEFKNKWVILLALTSNKGGGDFQLIQSDKGHKLYEYVIAKSQTWATPENLMYVVGATKSAYLTHIRTLAPEHFLLVPGVGAQGGSLKEVMDAAFIPQDCGLLVNSSRGIIYAGGQDEYFQEMVKDAAAKVQKQMAAKF